MHTVIEYRVKPVTRFIVTRCSREESPCRSMGTAGRVETRGEFDNAETAQAIAYALCKLEHDLSGEEPGSMNFIYPKPA